MTKYRLIIYIIIYIIGYIRGRIKKKDEFYERLWELENDAGYQTWKEYRIQETKEERINKYERNMG